MNPVLCSCIPSPLSSRFLVIFQEINVTYATATSVNERFRDGRTNTSVLVSAEEEESEGLFGVVTTCHDNLLQVGDWFEQLLSCFAAVYIVNYTSEILESKCFHVIPDKITQPIITYRSESSVCIMIPTGEKSDAPKMDFMIEGENPLTNATPDLLKLTGTPTEAFKFQKITFGTL